MICVGTTGSGKTTFAARLARSLKAPCIQLDEIHWLPDWKERPTEDFLPLVGKAVAAERWVLDGNYNKARQLVWPRGTAIIWLNYSAPFTLARLASRTVRRVFDRQELFSGNRESFRQAFLSSDSIFVWFFKSFWKNRRRYRPIFDGNTWPNLHRTEFRSPAETERFLSELERRDGGLDPAASSPR